MTTAAVRSTRRRVAIRVSLIRGFPVLLAGRQVSLPARPLVGPSLGGGYFRPVVAIPLTRYFWPKRKMRNSGIKETMDIANIAPHELCPVESRKDRKAMGTVYMSGSVRKISWEKKSFQVQMKVKIAVVARAGRDSGSMIW